MAILVINAGSSSVKFTLFGADAATPSAGGIVERIGLIHPRFKFSTAAGASFEQEVGDADADAAVGTILSALTDPQTGVLGSVKEISAVGHRVVHGGEALTRPVIINAAVKAVIAECARIAPLHNPPNLAGIEACEHRIPHAVQVAVFDTAFHATIPPHAFLYGLPYRFYREDRIRRYGFHGISHKYVSEEAARFLGRPLAELCIITCHLGNGCSITAVKGGKSIDTSMGFTPLEGLIMGTRCGDLDPAVVLHLMAHRQLSTEAANNLLNKQSGMLGMAEIGSSDLRDVVEARDKGNALASTALEAFCYRVKKYIGAYTAAMGGLDALVFTAGIGENSPEVRQRVCQGLEAPGGLGIALDPSKNGLRAGVARAVHAEGSCVRILVIPTNEELEIARETLQLVTGVAP
ncbi:MAG: acetate kinase [Desulfobacterales bacterium]